MERMERLLLEASIQGSVASLLTLLQQDPLLLDRLTLNGYNETPLHMASMLGHIDFFKEILTRKPLLAMECDSQRRLPLHIAFAKGHVDIVKTLVSANPETCLAGDCDGRSPLHLAAIKGHDDVVKVLVQAQPNAVTAMVQDETILHLCVKHNQLEILKFLVQTKSDHEFVNSKDADGNTILHLAVADKQIETINFLLLHTTIEVNISNANGDTPMDVLAQRRRDVKDLQIMGLLKGTKRIPNYAQSTIRLGGLEDYEKTLNSHSHLQIGWKKHDDWLEKKRNTLMVVASLIATMAFQAGLNPPKGVWQDDKSTVDPPHKAGYAIMAYENQRLYNVFLISNTVSFISTLSVILLLISGLPFLKRRFFMWLLMVIMWIATTTTAFTYYVSIYALTPHPDDQETFVKLAGGIVLVWLGLMALILVGHAIRLTLRLILSVARKLKDLVFPAKRSISTPMVVSHA